MVSPDHLGGVLSVLLNIVVSTAMKITYVNIALATVIEAKNTTLCSANVSVELKSFLTEDCILCKKVLIVTRGVLGSKGT
jgi:hypothetical protein